ncbi:hypothetical protein Taro_028505 [Colocasia esculenta]|uniref:Reticulon-like protein n=1 Tax=Colocasia esculenta TaxID=4460 RepID=A0A843VHF5_COLES|nr:hypothetical protein [Colocasia esculenta]
METSSYPQLVWRKRSVHEILGGGTGRIGRSIAFAGSSPRVALNVVGEVVLICFWFVGLRLTRRMGLTVADVMLWRRRDLTVGILLGMLAAWIVFEKSGYTLLSLAGSVLLLLISILFVWAKSAAILGRPPPPMPEFHLSEETIKEASAFIHSHVNAILSSWHDITHGKDSKLFYKVAAFLWLISVIGSWTDFLTLGYTSLLIMLTVPALYERYEEYVDDYLVISYGEAQRICRLIRSPNWLFSHLYLTFSHSLPEAQGDASFGLCNERLNEGCLFASGRMFTSNRAPQRDGKAPASPVPPSPPAPQAPPSLSTYSPDYWKGFYIGWNMALQKASRLYHHKGLTNILPDIGPRAEHICSSPSSGPSPGRSSSSLPASTE